MTKVKTPKRSTGNRSTKAQALWTRNKSDIEKEEYQEFYKHVSHDFADPLTWSHNKVEGKNDKHQPALHPRESTLGHDEP
ncbi:hypothetical protein O9993_13265 [Vibrio lentus]|nr:hypothetical protein [Vibrio lentus]